MTKHTNQSINKVFGLHIKALEALIQTLKDDSALSDIKRILNTGEAIHVSVEDIGDAVRKIREIADMKQSELAKGCGLATSSISHLEKGNRLRFDTLEKVLSQLGYQLKFSISKVEEEGSI